MLKWRGESIHEVFDGAEWIREEEPKIVHNLKKILSSMENDFANGKFLTRTCSMEIKNLNRAVYGLNQSEPSSSITVANCLMNHLNALASCLDSDRDSRWWGLYHDVCINLCSTFQDTLVGLQYLESWINRSGAPSGFTDQEVVDVDGSVKPDTEQSKSLGGYIDFVITYKPKVVFAADDLKFPPDCPRRK